MPVPSISRGFLLEGLAQPGVTLEKAVRQKLKVILAEQWWHYTRADQGHLTGRNRSALVGKKDHIFLLLLSLYICHQQLLIR